MHGLNGLNRREFFTAVGVGAAALAIPGLSRAEDESQLIYLSPLKSNGALSRCQAEVWYVQDGTDMCVVTAADAWRARAIEQGLNQTQIWVGNVGLWHNADGKYKALPSLAAVGSVERDAVQHAQLLEKFGAKYSAEWGTWGPRFQKGLADGSRVMLRYSPT